MSSTTSQEPSSPELQPQMGRVSKVAEAEEIKLTESSPVLNNDDDPPAQIRVSLTLSYGRVICLHPENSSYPMSTLKLAQTCVKFTQHED